MSALSIQPTYPIFTDIDGQPLEDGYVWVGTANLDPQTNPIAVFWDAALTIAAVQPIRTLAGYPSNSGTPARLYVNSDYSIRVMNKKGSAVYSAPVATERYSGNLISQISADQVSTVANGVGAATNLTQQDYNDNAVYATQFGVVGNGIADDTAALQAALNAHKHVIIPSGLTPLVSASVTVPSRTRLQFMGGLGNLPGAMPGSYLIMKSTMATPAILIEERATVDGGGILGQIGNTGDGVQLVGNSAALRNFIVCQAGRDGVRVGVDGPYRNSNSTVIEFVKAKNNGRHGFYVHDGVGVGPADANAGTLLQCEADANGADGIRLGHCFWVSVINCLTEVNTGYGLKLSGTANGVGDVYPECRWATVVGGDFNEGNTAGQIYDQSYFSTFVNADSNNMPTTVGNGLQGSAVRCKVGGSVSQLSGLTVTGYPLTVSGGASGSLKTDFVIESDALNNNAAGRSLLFKDTNAGTPRSSGRIASYQATTNQDSMGLSVNYNGALEEFLKLNPNARAVHSFGDGGINLGLAGARWATVFAATGTINTSDAREKQQVRDLSDQEKAVAVRLKGMIKAFKFNDAVETKGEAARIHVGVIAQEVKAAFEAEGLVAEHYAVLCYDEWPDEYVPEFKTVIETVGGNPVETQVTTGEQKLVRAAGNRYGVRHDQLFSFIISTL